MIRAALLVSALAAPVAAQERVATIGGSVTEIVYALGQEDRLVARDSTSTWPEAATALPDVGYVRALSPEGVLSVSPDLVLADEGSGPPEAIDVLRKASVPVVLLPADPTAEGIAAKVEEIGRALGVEGDAEALAGTIRADLAAAKDRAAAIPEEKRKRVLFVLSLQGGRIMASGEGTSAASMIEMAGAVNAVEGFEGYKPVTEEAVIAAAPDVILMMDRGTGHDPDGLFGLPAIAATPAGKNRALVTMDGLYLLGFGPRTADAVSDLSHALYAE